jgi:hypothetical protein
MSDKKSEEISNIERLHRWMEAVGGNLFPGDSELKSVKESKDGDKLTIILKKKKQKKAKKRADQSEGQSASYSSP